MRSYAQALAADVVSCQEVDGPMIAAQLFTPDRYAIHITQDHVVQRTGLAIRKGIAFTANPVTGDRAEVVISAVQGSGERLVSGQVTPDEWVVRDQEAVCRAAREGAIGANQALAVAALARRVEAHFGGIPQDIEWALDGAGTLWLTQARPITTLYPLPTLPDGDLHAYLCGSLAQGLTRPVTPMGIAAFRLMASCASELVFDSAVSDPVAGPTAFAPFAAATKYFGRAEQQFMLNFRVRNLDAMVAQLRRAGITVAVDPEKYPNGVFARLADPEGNPIELWQELKQASSGIQTLNVL